MKTFRHVIAAAALSVFAVPAAMATGVLLGTGTLNTTDDLTRIQVGSNVLEFLDLSTTSGSTVSAAVSAYSGNGFHWATGSEVSDLYSAFGITYANSPGAVSDLGAGLAERTSFVGYLGQTAGQAGHSLGWIDDLTGGGFHTYSCIAIDSCGPLSFVYNVPDNYGIWPAEFQVGVFLVRDGVPAVPEPTTYALMAAGLAGLAALRRRRGSKN